MYKQVTGITCMHACRSTTDNVQETYNIGIYIIIINVKAVGHYYREMCFQLATCADFTIPFLILVNCSETNFHTSNQVNTKTAVC